MENTPGRTVAFIDIGTNSIRMLLVRINPNQSYSVLNQEKEVVRLGEGEFVDQHLQVKAMHRAALVCSKFANMARAYEADEIIAIATSATREAKNKAEFLRLLETTAGLDVHTISGHEEARLIYHGIASGFHLEEKKAIFIDIGGGSTEVIVGGQHEYQYLDSLKLGAIRLTSLFFLPDETGPVPEARYSLIQQYVRNAAIRTLQNVRELSFDVAIGSSGTIENLGDIAAQHFYERRRGPDDILQFEQLVTVLEMLRGLPLDERRRIPGMNPQRADIIIAGGAILHTLMEDLEIPAVHISDRGLRDGLLVDYLVRTGHADYVQGISVRERSILQLGRTCGFEEAHARQVARLALELFDSAREAGLHDLGAREQELLEYAALLHDIGTFLTHTSHHAHSYYLIRNADLLGFDQTEIDLIATLAYFHRKAYPRKKHGAYRTLDLHSREKVRVLSVFLQLAESLDRSHAAVVQHARLQAKNKKKALLTLEAQEDCQLELWGVENQKRNFQKIFGRKLNVRAEVQSPI